MGNFTRSNFHSYVCSASYNTKNPWRSIRENRKLYLSATIYAKLIQICILFALESFLIWVSSCWKMTNLIVDSTRCWSKAPSLLISTATFIKHLKAAFIFPLNSSFTRLHPFHAPFLSFWNLECAWDLQSNGKVSRTFESNTLKIPQSLANRTASLLVFLQNAKFNSWNSPNVFLCKRNWNNLKDLFLPLQALLLLRHSLWCRFACVENSKCVWETFASTKRAH